MTVFISLILIYFYMNLCFYKYIDNLIRGTSIGGILLSWLVGGAIVIVLVISSSIIEKTLKSIKEQNDTIIELLREINKK